MTKEILEHLNAIANYIDEQDEVIKVCKRRAEVAERALFYICKETAEIPSYMVAINKMERLLRQAEKQLDEEIEDDERPKKDD